MTYREMPHEGRHMGRILAMHDERGPEYAAITCTICRRETRIRESEGVSDAELTRQFEEKGWTIKPTRCPEHVGMAVEDAGTAAEGADATA